jgi:hypothetical protein
MRARSSEWLSDDIRTKLSAGPDVDAQEVKSCNPLRSA